MKPITADITSNSEKKKRIVNATKMRLSLFRCFSYNDTAEEINIIHLIGNYLLDRSSNLAFYGHGKFFRYFLKHFPKIKNHIKQILLDDIALDGSLIEGIQVTTPLQVSQDTEIIFICDIKKARIWQKKRNLADHLEVITPEIVQDIDWTIIPEKAWIPDYPAIYPVNIPEINFYPNQDMIVIDCPSRDMAYLPNGVGYVHNILKNTGINFQTVDLDIIIYHQFHIHRLFDAPKEILTPKGNKLPDDPWLTVNENYWQKEDTIEYFRTEINEITQKLLKACPKILGFSIHQRNLKFSLEVMSIMKKLLPDIIIVIGGYCCNQPLIKLKFFPLADYMIVGEAELTLPPLIKELIKGNRPAGLAGIISKQDPQNHEFIPGPLLEKLDEIDMPKYDWYDDISIYRNYDHYQLTPILSSRGCKWSKCRFCGERFLWRNRHPVQVVDEFEWLVEQGFSNFLFNESDLNGQPQILLEICDEIIKRELLIKLNGQLRINKKSTEEFFNKLKQAGFAYLRFGVDAWSQNTMKLQNKGYKPKTVSDNLKACREAGIWVDVNAIIGIPGETEDDINEMIELLSENKNNIGQIANINPIILLIGSFYWTGLDKYNIKLIGYESTDDFLKQQTEYGVHVPNDQWYSEKPYIDANVRNKRLEKFLQGLYDNHVNIGPYAQQKLDTIKKAENNADTNNNNTKSANPEKNAILAGFDSNKDPVHIIKIKNEFYSFSHINLENYSSSFVKKLYWSLKIPFTLYLISSGNLKTQLFKINTIKKAIADFSRYYSVATGHVSLAPNFIDKTIFKILLKLKLVSHQPDFSVVKKFSEYFSSLTKAKIVSNLKILEQEWDKSIIPYFGNLFNNDSQNKKLNNNFISRLITENQNFELKVRKNRNLDIDIIHTNYYDFDIFQSGSEYYAVKKGYKFDLVRADYMEYPNGACLKAGTVKDLTLSIKNFQSIQTTR